jgi:hypothetical protein
MKIKGEDQGRIQSEAAHDVNSDGARLSRRRALLTGLTAAPVLLTLINRPAWGAECSTAILASFQQGGNLLTASFQRRHPNATIDAGGELTCQGHVR